jgi:hypothetical protein
MIEKQKKKLPRGLLCYISSYCTSPFSDKSIARGLVVSNLEKMILKLVMRGTAKNAPTKPQRLPQKRSERRMIKPLRLSLLQNIFGSRKFPVIV